jgi:hypothetical protein
MKTHHWQSHCQSGFSGLGEVKVTQSKQQMRLGLKEARSQNAMRSRSKCRTFVANNVGSETQIESEWKQDHTKAKRSWRRTLRERGRINEPLKWPVRVGERKVKHACRIAYHAEQA